MIEMHFILVEWNYKTAHVNGYSGMILHMSTIFALLADKERSPIKNAWWERIPADKEYPLTKKLSC